MIELPPVPQQRPSTDFDNAQRSVKGTLSCCVVVFACGSSGAFWILQQAPTLLFLGTALLLYWGFVVAGIQYLYLAFEMDLSTTRRASRFANIGQWILDAVALAAIAKYLSPTVTALGDLNQTTPDTQRLFGILFLGMGCGLFILTNYASAVHKRLNSVFLVPILYLAQVMLFVCMTTAIVLFLFLSTANDYSLRFGWLFLAIDGVLLIEPLARLSARIYLPRSLCKTPAPVGSSLLLTTLFGSKIKEAEFVKDLERLVGTKFREVWIFRFLKETIGPVLVIGLLVGWLSNCWTSVPLGSRGVLISFGSYRDSALSPGVHLIWPWPFQQIVAVETERIRELSLGFDKDLSNPILWTEKHAEGEKNLLVDNGESLLTINVPIFYRISDAVTYLKTTSDPETALKSLAERKLIQIAASRESFHFMTEDRQAIADFLKTGLQAEVDHLNLGLEITFVGLKDIHPPLTVAPAYQKVISSQEQKEAMIDQARAYEAHTIPLANAQATGLTVAADAAYTQRVDQSAGEAGRFEGIIASERTNPTLFRLRLKYDMLDETLAKATKTIVGMRSQTAPDYYLDLRTGTSSTKAGNISLP